MGFPFWIQSVWSRSWILFIQGAACACEATRSDGASWEESVNRATEMLTDKQVPSDPPAHRPTQAQAAGTSKTKEKALTEPHTESF